MAVTNYYSIHGQIVGEKTAGGSRVDYLTDALGSVTGTVDQSANVINTYRYKPFGGLLAKTGVGSDPAFQWVGTQGYRQTGKAFSDVYIRARHYSSAMGKWTSKDPYRKLSMLFLRIKNISEPIHTLNLYSYTQNTPAHRIDPSGYDNDNCALLFQVAQAYDTAAATPGCPWKWNTTGPKSSVDASTWCIPDKGIKTWYFNDWAAAQPCLKKHEDTHVAHLSDCCKKFQAKYQSSDQAGKQAACKKWLEEYLRIYNPISECKAHVAGWQCADGLYKTNNCDKNILYPTEKNPSTERMALVENCQAYYYFRNTQYQGASQYCFIMLLWGLVTPKCPF